MTSISGDIGLNQVTCDAAPTATFLKTSAAAGFGAVTLWRHKVGNGLHDKVRGQAADLGLQIASLCRGGFFTTGPNQRAAHDDNRRAIDEAVALGAPLLVLVCGPSTDGNLTGALSRIRTGVEGLLDYASQAGIGLAVEPFHPMFVAERSALISLRQANDLLDQIDHPSLSIALDTYHVWWDPELPTQLRRAGKRVSIVHVADWLVPTTSLLRGRGLPGDGIIQLAPLLAAIKDSGFTGWFEVETLNDDLLEESPAVTAELAHRAMSGLLHPGARGDP